MAPVVDASARILSLRFRRISTLGVVLSCLASTCGRPAAGGETGGIAAALAAMQGIAPRLSVATPFRNCVDRVAPDGTVPRAQCSAPGKHVGNALALTGIKPGADDPRSVHLLALLDLTANDPRGIALDRAITSLRRVVEMSDDPTPALVDLSAALIVRAERQQTPRDLLEAYETAQKAADRQPRNPAALYNRALALDRFGLVEETAEDWTAALTADSTSAWAAEARRRLRALQSIHAPVPPRDDAPLADYARYAAEDAQGARELGMDKLLPAWGDATLRGDRSRADDCLSRAEALGTALLLRPGGDASLADMVRVIRGRAADSVTSRKLAEAHRDYGSGRQIFEQADYEGALPQIERVKQNATNSPALHAWTQVYLAMLYAYNGHPDAGTRLLETISRGTNATRYSALSARVLLALATSLQRAERWERGLDEAQRAAQLSARTGEKESLGGALSMEADAWFLLSELDSGYSAFHRSIKVLQPYRVSVRLHNALLTSARAAYADGLGFTALALQNEDVRVAERIGPRIYPAEARLQHVRFQARLGRRAGLTTDIEVLRQVVDGIPHPRAREWARSELREAEALVVLQNDPVQQANALDEAAKYFQRIPLRALPDIVGAAEARFRAGDAAGAAHRLDQAMELLEQRRNSIRVEPRRAAVFESAWGAVHRLLGVEIARGNTSLALAYLDRARASLAPAGMPSDSDAEPRSRPGESAITYALIGDTLLAWTITDTTVDIARSSVDTTQLFRTVQRVEALLERGVPEVQLRPGLSSLYDILIRPVVHRLGDAGRPIVLIPDERLAAVPFAALYDRETSKYLIESHPLRFQVSLRDALRSAPAQLDDKALFVSDPAFDQWEFPLLDRLPRAAAEVVAAAARYPHAQVLSGPAATATAFNSAMRDAAVVHFAGHAVFDDSRPEQSYLVLANRFGEGTGRITVAELVRRDHSRTRLFVLSACRTVRTAGNGLAGYTGLTGALLATGVGGTIGTTWDVDDASTSVLLSVFHQEYHRTEDPVSSLRSAQLKLLHSRDSRLQSPAAWAAFRYTGR